MKIISGGQTGADRAALDVAIEQGLDYGGWAPRGFKAEDGRLSMRYTCRMSEMPTSIYDDRTRQNIVDSDGTLVCHTGMLAGGTLLTVETTRALDKPLLVLNLAEVGPERAVEHLHDWIRRNAIEVLNVAGPRASHNGHIYDLVHDLLSHAFGEEDD